MVKKSPGPEKSYQQLKDELEEILNKLQHEDTDIDQAIELHKNGRQVLAQLEAYLKKITDGVDKE
jgi:exodeoxyribonuclease VII small subunit